MSSGVDERVPLPDGKTMVLKATEYWPRNSDSIKAGSLSQGWLFAVFNGVKINEVTKKPRLTISCVDVVSHNTHPFTIPLATDTPGILKFPGEF